MIKNLVFDIGMVLVDFRWKDLMHEMGYTGEMFERIAKATVQGPWWNEFDRSLLPNEEIIRRCAALAPEYETEIRQYFTRVGENCREYPFAKEWLAGYRAKGLRIYLLSNYSRLSYENATPPFAFLDVVDGALISYEVQIIKPEAGIYKALLDRYGLVPEECVMIDDNPDNIAAAKALGMQGIVHRSRAETDRILAAML
ncbi:MAG: HAD-IA family hydrolase [Firmicutes bacterium]|nr:HAD-IA family hydrolase [Bacillota bacterium]